MKLEKLNVKKGLKILLWFIVIITLTSWVGGLLLYMLFGLPLTHCYPWTIYRYFMAYGMDHKGPGAAVVTACTFGPWMVTLWFALDRLLHYKKRKLHGDARYATFDEIKKAGLMPKGKDLERTILIGKYRDKYLCYGGTQFVLLAAPTRSGKGVGIVIPNCLNYSDSLVVLDIKLENYRITSGYRKHCGQEVYLFSPFDTKGRTHRYNPLSYISKDPAYRINDIDTIAAALFSSKVSSEEFWSDQARDMFRGLCLFVLEQENIPHTLGEMLRQASGCGMPLKDYIQQTLEKRQKENKPFSSNCIDCLNRLITMPDNTFGSVVATFNSKMKIYANPLVDMATSDNDFDLRDVRRKKMTIYFGVTPNKLADAAGLVNLFFDQLINLNVTEMPEDNPEELKYQCLMIMDEFTSIGKVNIINKSVAFQAGYNMRLLTIIQNKSQLEQCYEKAGATTLLSNHAVQIIYQPSSATPQDANEYSDMIGYQTVRNESKTISYNSTSESFSDQKRALVLPQELRELGDMEIVCTDRCKPFKCNKIKYYEDPNFRSRAYGPRLSGKWTPSGVPIQDVGEFLAINEKRIRPITEDDCKDPDKANLLYSEKPFPVMADPDEFRNDDYDEMVGGGVDIFMNDAIEEVEEQHGSESEAKQAVDDVFGDFMDEEENVPEELEEQTSPAPPLIERQAHEEVLAPEPIEAQASAKDNQPDEETITEADAIKKFSSPDLDKIDFDTILGGAKP